MPAVDIVSSLTKGCADKAVACPLAALTPLTGDGPFAPATLFVVVVADIVDLLAQGSVGFMSTVCGGGTGTCGCG